MPTSNTVRQPGTPASGDPWRFPAAPAIEGEDPLTIRVQLIELNEIAYARLKFVAAIFVGAYGPIRLRFHVSEEGSVEPEVPPDWHRAEFWSKRIADAISCADWPADLEPRPTLRVVPSVQDETPAIATPRSDAYSVREPGTPARARSLAAADRVREAASHRELIAQLTQETTRIRNDCGRRVSGWDCALQDVNEILPLIEARAAALQTERRQYIMDSRDGYAVVVSRIDTEIAELKLSIESYTLRRDHIVSELPGIRQQEEALLAELRGRLAAAQERSAAHGMRLLELYPAVREFVAEVKVGAEIESEIRRIGTRALAAAISLAELGVDLAAPYRTSARTGTRTGVADGSLTRGLRVPGVAPAFAAEAPAWLYMPPE